MEKKRVFGKLSGPLDVFFAQNRMSPVIVTATRICPSPFRGKSCRAGMRSFFIDFPVFYGENVGTLRFFPGKNAIRLDFL